MGLGSIGSILGGAVGTAFGGPIGGAIGSSLFAPKAKKGPRYTPPTPINSFTSGMGEFKGGTDPSFTYGGPSLPAGVYGNIENIVNTAGMPTQDRLNAFQGAYQDQAMRNLTPELDRRTAELNARISARGGTGNSRNILAQGEDAKNRANAMMDVTDKSIMLREQLMENAIRNELAQLNAFQGMSQHDVMNKINAQNAALNAVNALQGTANQGAGMQNNFNQTGFLQQQGANQQALQNAFSYAGLGASLGDSMPSIGSIFGKKPAPSFDIFSGKGYWD